MKKDHNKSPPPGKERRRIVWDEDVIAQHDLERGTRQVIDEPPTPYHGPADELFEVEDSIGEMGQEDGNIAPVPLNNKKKEGTSSPQPNWNYLQAVADQLNEKIQTDQKKADFERRRREHYDEGRRVKSSKPPVDKDDNLGHGK